ncbi:ABC transporter permease [Sphingomonas sp. LR61]|uniref:ABC transporter permease n=1 Tax=Bacteria TaxID=2 RepID=UPI001047744A|nr:MULTISPECIES: ABC transporter permease [unclassified Curtobacterium]MBF4588086.1 ABC transporter permease [Curtobacterium sp. VKM Ac-2887]TCU84018.1 peptide/nickel transport system permease protein [Curtobacterium sp. PhB191]
MVVRVTRRLVEAVVLLLAVGTIVFFLEHAVPGDPAVAILGGAAAHPTKEAVAAVTEQYGFDRPLIVQYGDFLGGLFRLDFGESYTLKQSVTTVVAGQIGPTLALTVSALVIAWLLSIASTLVTAGRPGMVGRLGSVVETVAAGLPQFWLGLVLLLVFAVQLHWFPVIGSGVLGIVLPALTLAIPLAGFLGQVTRDEFEDKQQQPFVLSARSRGLSDRAIRGKYVLRHAALPGVTLSGWGLGSLVSGAVIAEVVFARQGIGQVLVTAVSAQDLPLVIGITFVVALVYVVANILTDIAYVLVDPRLRHTSGAAA